MNLSVVNEVTLNNLQQFIYDAPNKSCASDVIPSYYM